MVDTRSRRLKAYLKTHFPTLAHYGRKLKYLLLRVYSPETIFTNIYQKNTWGDQSSYSGTGSNLDQTAAIRRAIPLLVHDLGCRSLLDIPCGDFFWMSQTDLEVEHYIGADIVETLIIRNQERYGQPQRTFVKLNIMSDPLPQADLVLCRDCLVHFSFTDIGRALNNLKLSGSTYLLTTTFVDRPKNEDISTGDWRPLNLQAAPFCFPAPLQLIDEQCTEGGGMHADKHLALWRIADLPV